MIKLAVITTTRAEYGLLFPLIEELRSYESGEFRVELIVSGTHLDKKYGNTIDEIKKDSVRIDHIVKIPTESKKRTDTLYNQAEIIKSFTSFFSKNIYDGVVLLGDRYEIMIIALVAAELHIPIFHLCGGDTTEGATDEFYRHSITKMSQVHFPTNEESRRRIIQLGENPEKVFNYGHLGLDNIVNCKYLTKKEVLDSIGLNCDSYALCTYHPTTLEDADIEMSINGFLNALHHFPDIHFIITKSNSDYGGELINSILDKDAKKNKNIHVYSSLGVKRYLSLMKHSLFVLGNSSSGILEAPSFGIPIINIGNRQKGRMQAKGIINCGDSEQEIIGAINKALNPNVIKEAKKMVNPYGDGKTAPKIAKKIYELLINKEINIFKSFYMI